MLILMNSWDPDAMDWTPTFPNSGLASKDLGRFNWTAIAMTSRLFIIKVAFFAVRVGGTGRVGLVRAEQQPAEVGPGVGLWNADGNRDFFWWSGVLKQYWNPC